MNVGKTVVPSFCLASFSNLPVGWPLWKPRQLESWLYPPTRRLTLLLFSIFFLGCSQDRIVEPAFYHWKTRFHLSDFEKTYLDSLGVKKLYVKFFDVDWDSGIGQAIPLALANFLETPSEQLTIVPTIFITNRTFQNLPPDSIGSLASKIKNKIFDMTEALPNPNFHEIQIDCDWTQSTKNDFFEFLRALKTKIDNPEIALSATIRLHQIRYFEKTGVPPVDRGMLMFYNMGDVENPETENSILDLNIARKYFQNFEKYPLELDIALPLFRWGVVFRDGKMVRLINNLSEKDLEDKNRFERLTQKKFRAAKSTYLDGYYLYKKDVIRLEKVTQKQLEESVRLLRKVVDNQFFTISFYHLDSLNLAAFPFQNIKAVLNGYVNSD